jgi:hypothetical protein
VQIKDRVPEAVEGALARVPWPRSVPVSAVVLCEQQHPQKGAV